MNYEKYNELVNLVADRKKILTSINEVKSFVCEKNNYNKKYIRNSDGDGMYVNKLAESMSVEDINNHLKTFKTLLISDLNKKLEDVNREINKYKIEKVWCWIKKI